MKNPFTHTPGRVGDANIVTTIEEKVYDNFRYQQPSECVYKITGIRGSGKTVIFGNILRHYKTADMKADGWLVYDLSSARRPINTLISYLLLESEVKKVLLSEKTNLSVSIPIVGISAGFDSKTDIDEEVRLEQLVGILIKAKKKIMIGIDDIAKTDEMAEFCSVYAKLIRNVMDDEIAAPWPVYLICSGVYQNFYELGEVPNLTFFKRAVELKTEAFPMPAMAIKYEDKTGMEEDMAISFAKMTKGFAYAYQVFGSAYFEYKDKGEEYVVKQAKSELFSQCYEKIWKELPEGEREILKIVSSGPKKRKDVIAEMDGKGNYQVNSNALKKMGLLADSAQSYGIAEITLPFFGEYIQKYC
ncbi:hypothetical protein [Butyrivibrio sp. AE3003]|uniref:hypothetical protein n=1 Tax=Butyrivibrio sp. AE3003 TaxID=1496721 RepID=UPI00047B9236|nr:hypothetical protein [Butyrivibrio sp. AE3003]